MASGQGGATIVLPARKAHAQGGAPIDFSALGRPNSTTSKYQQHREWVQSELRVLLENDLSRELQTELDSQAREYEVLQTKYNTFNMTILEKDDEIFDLKSKMRGTGTREKELLASIDALNADHEALLAQLSDSQHHDSATIHQLGDLRTKNRDLESQVAELNGEIDDLRASNTKMREKEQHLNLVIEQKNVVSSRSEQLQRQVETLQADYQQAVRDREMAINAQKTAEQQMRTLQQDSATANSTSTHYRERITSLQTTIEQLQTENEEIRTRGGGNFASRGGAGGGASGQEVEQLQMEIEQMKADFAKKVEQKDKMLNEVKNALKGLGLKIGNMDSKTAIPKLKALLSILQKQVGEYKGRQKELEHLLKARLNEIHTLQRKMDKRGIEYQS